MAAVDAVYPAARNPMAFPWLARGGLAAHKVRRLYLMWSNQPDAWVDVTGAVDRKIEALRSHASQIHDAEGVFARIRGRMVEQGERIGAAAAEAYRLVVLDQDPDEDTEDPTDA
jgi:LmbE family N-acetylglucosaminyl deacetylase